VLPESNKNEVIKYASICESVSVHPIAKAILKEGILVDTSNYIIKEFDGKGVIAENLEEKIICGSRNFLKENGIEVLENLSNYTTIYIAKNSQYLGCVNIGDELKEESTNVIKSLNKKGVVAIISGDNKNSVEFFANKLDVKHLFYEMLPQQKIKILDKLIKENKEFCYIGDGINDAGCLARADVGISMGKNGSDIALEYSDVVFMNDNLNSIFTAKKICKKTMRIVKQNVVFSLLIKFLVMALAFFGIANMWLAIFADVGVAFLAILNAMRTFIKSK